MRFINQVFTAFIIWICASQSFRSQYRHIALPADLRCMANGRLREYALVAAPEEAPPTLSGLFVCPVLSSECDGRTSGRGRADGRGRTSLCIGKRC